MALTKAQTSLVTVATLGVAPGGYQENLAAFASQKEAAAFIASSGLLNVGTDAEFALQVIKNLGVTTPTADDKAAFLKALTSGTSRADAAVDFANAQLLANDGKIESVSKAIASTSTSTDLSVLKAEITADPLTITFKDDEKNQSGAENTAGQTVVNIGKAELDAGANKISADYTFKLAGQIGAGDTFTGKFLSPIIEAQAPEKTGSQIVLELRNLRESDASSTPLKSLPTEGFAFTMDGVTLLVASNAINAANTYAELRDAVEARVNELAQGTDIPNRDNVSNDPAAYAKLATFKVELGNTFNAQNESGATVTGQQVVLTDSAGSTLKPLAFVNSSDVIVDTGFTLYAELKEAAASTVTKLITTNLVADNVGYGSQGGSVNLAGQSNSDKGVEEIKVTAKNGVWFSKLQSKTVTTEHLERIELLTGSNGYFRVGTQTAEGNTHVVNLTVQDFSKAGLIDVREVEATNAGSTAINALVTDKVIARDYNLKDTGSWANDNIDINYNLSSGRDVLNLAVDQDVMESTDTQVAINTNAGDDVIHFQVAGDTTTTVAATTGTNWLTNQQLLNNVKVNAGDGNDQVVMSGAGNATVNAGTGNDEVRADNTGKLALFVFNNGNTTNVDTLSNSDNALSSGANAVAQTYDLFKAVVKVTFQGFESAAVVIDSTNFKTSTLQINQAIKKAIAESPQLSKLLAAHDNDGHALGLESLVDGVLNTSDLNISITAPAAYKANETAAEAAARAATGQQMLAENDLLNAAKAANPAATTATDIAVLNNAVNSLNNSVYATEFATDGQGTSNQLQVQTIDFKGISALPAGHPLSGTTGELTVGGATVKITAGMSATDIAQAAAKALSQQYAASATNASKFVKAEAVGEQVKVYFDSNATLLTSSVTGSTTFLSAKALPTTVVTGQSITGNTAAAAAVDGKATLDFAGVNVTTASPANSQIKVTIGTTETLVSVAPGEGGLGIAQAVQQALNGKSVTIGAETLAVTATLLDEKVNLTLKGGANDVTITGNVVVANTTGATAATLSGSALPAASAITDYTKAVVTVPGTRTVNFDFDGMQVTEAGSITIAGVSIALAKGDDDRAIAKKVHDALNTKVVDNATITSTHTTEQTTVSLSISAIGASTTPISEVAISNITAGFANSSATPGVSFSQAFVDNGVTGVVAGSDSTAESDNIINLDTGTDLVMMGTGANSNDTLVLTGYNNGTNTVVNYDGSASSKGVDYLDLSAYVAGQNKVVLGSVANASGTLADKAVAKIAVNAADFAKLTDAEMLAQLNGSTTAAITGLAGIDASTTASNYVLMVENSNNPGEYKVFHLSAAANNAGKFASAQTVATLDFGVQSTPSVSNVDVVATLSTAGVLTLPTTVSSTDVIKGLAINVADITAGADTTTLSNAVVKSINDLNLDQLTFRFSDTVAPKDTLKLAYGQTLKAANLTVWDGTLDATAGTLNVSGTITLNSVLKVSVAQAEQLANSNVKFTSNTTTTSAVLVVADTAADKAKLAAIQTKLEGKFDTTGGGAKPQVVEVTTAASDNVRFVDMTGATNLGAVAANETVVISGAFTATANSTVGAGATFKVGTGSTLSIAATDASAKAITGAGNVAVTALGTDEVDLSKITATGTKTAAFTATGTLHADTKLNGITVDVANGQVLTGTAAQLVAAGGFTNTGSVVMTGAAAAELTTANAAKFAAGLTVNAQLAETAGDLSGQTLTNIDTLDLGQADVTATLSQAQALKVANSAANDVITITGVDATNMLAVENTGGIVVAATVNAQLTATAADIAAINHTKFDTLELAANTTNLAVSAAQVAKLSGVDATDAITVKTLNGATVAATAAADTFVFAATDAAVIINGFTTATDKIDLKALTLTAGTITAAADTIVAGKIYTITGAGAGSADTTGAAATAIDTALDGSGALTDAADTEVAYFTVVDDNSSAIYKYTATNGETGVTSNELTLVGTFDAQIAAGDFVLA